MKVCVSVSSASRAGGGVFTAAAALYSRLAEMPNVEVLVLAPRDKFHQEDAIAWGKCRLIHLSKVDFFSRYTSIVRQLNPDIVHIHGLWTFTAFSGAFAAKRLGVPYVISPHGMLDPWARANSKYKKDGAWALFQKRQFYAATRVHALNLKEVSSVRQCGYRGEISVLPNGVDLLAAPEVNLNTDAKRMCFLGRIHPKKGIDILIEAWAIALGKTDSALLNWSLEIAGWDDGGHVDGYKSRVDELGLTDVIRFVAPKFDQEKFNFLSGSSAFILPSRSEGLPVAVLEAWERCIPVLGSVETNLVDEINSGCGVVISLNQDELARQLVAFAELDLEQRVEMGQKGRCLVEDRFSWRKIAKQFYELYQTYSK
ncbi:MAG: glycosyltransferase [Verrucomicrobiota bacterium]